MAYSPGQRLLLRNGKFAQFVRPVLRLGGEIIEITLEGGSPRLVNARDVRVTDWSGVERRLGQRRRAIAPSHSPQSILGAARIAGGRSGERRRVKLPIARKVERRTHGARRKMDRRQFALPKKVQWSPRRA